MKKQSKKRDIQVNQFQRRDLGKDIKNSKSARVVKTNVRKLPTSIVLDPAIIDKLKEKAHSRGIGYQTMLKIIVHEHLEDY